METKNNELFTKYPNDIFDTLSSQGLPLTAYLSPAEEKILNRCVREANGYHRTKFRMSLSEMAKMTGLSKQGVINCVNSLAKSKLITYDASNGVGLWTLNLGSIEAILEYYVSQHRTTEFTNSSTELTGKKPKHRTTEFTNSSTELTVHQVSLPLSIKEISKETFKETTTTIATQNVAQKVVEVVTSQATSQDELIASYCNALQWDIRQNDNNRKATKAVGELKALYPSITVSEITNVIRHANEVYKLKPTQLLQNWLKLTNEVALMNDSHLTEIAQAIKAVYSLNGNTPYAKLWDIYGVASQAKLYQLQASDFTGFTSKWPSNLNLPNLDKLLTNIARIKGENEHASNRNGITGIGVGKVDPTTWDELASRTI